MTIVNSGVKLNKKCLANWISTVLRGIRMTDLLKREELPWVRVAPRNRFVVSKDLKGKAGGILTSGSLEEHQSSPAILNISL